MVSTWHMLVSKFDVDDVISWFCGAVGDLAGAVLLILGVDVHFAGALNGKAQATVSWQQQVDIQFPVFFPDGIILSKSPPDVYPHPECR